MGKEWILKKRARPVIKKTPTKVKMLTQMVVPTDPIVKKKTERVPGIKYKFSLPDAKGWRKRNK